MDLTWYLKRLSRMSVGEIGRRLADADLKRRWRRRQGQDPGTGDARLTGFSLAGHLPRGAALAGHLEPAATARLLTEAEALLHGGLTAFGHAVPLRDGVPDWFVDPHTGRQSDAATYAFDIDHRDEAAIGNIKAVWEAARHQYLPRLAVAWRLTDDARFAERIAADLGDFWTRNRFLSGVHWTSGIEIGIRLISWVWTRRLLDGWPGAAGLFERNPAFLAQLRGHQHWLHALPSHGSSANNHLIAEAAGAFVAAAAFPLFPESAQRRAEAATQLAAAFAQQTFGDGLNRELASGYHAFVAELVLAALVEGELGGAPFSQACWARLAAMLDGAAALLDVTGRPPRQGDDDEGLGLPIDPPSGSAGRWGSLLAAGDALVGRQSWWPEVRSDVRSGLFSVLRLEHTVAGRPEHRPSHFPESGVVILRDTLPVPDEIWCRLDSGPLGYLAIAAHGHADALSVELRHGGVDILADPGTYCYHGEAAWRRYFRSTIGHNTLELDGQDQAVDGGPFMWLRGPNSQLVDLQDTPGSTAARWIASHNGYARLRQSSEHRRTVVLDRATRRVEIEDLVTGGIHRARLAFHLGPEVSCRLEAGTALLSWSGPAGRWRARMTLPAGLRWSVHQGESDPPCGWYSPGFGQKMPTVTLIGLGRAGGGQSLLTTLAFEPEEPGP